MRVFNVEWRMISASRAEALDEPFREIDEAYKHYRRRYPTLRPTTPVDSTRNATIYWALLDHSATTASLAERFGICRSRVRVIAKRYGEMRRRRREEIESRHLRNSRWIGYAADAVEREARQAQKAAT
jgi:hypothetical protein